MNLIKEPLGVEFVVVNQLWTAAERAELSHIIQSAKKQAGHKRKGAVKRNFNKKHS